MTWCFDTDTEQRVFVKLEGEGTHVPQTSIVSSFLAELSTVGGVVTRSTPDFVSQGWA